MPGMDGHDHAKDKGDLASRVERARGGDRSALGELIAEFQEDIFRMVYYRTRSRMDAEDLTQEIFLKVFDNLPALKDPRMFRSWLFRIAVNKVYDYHRKKRFRALFVQPMEKEAASSMEDIRSDNRNALEQVVKKEFWHEIGVFTQKLSNLEREVFQLRFMDHLGIAEISQVLNKSESTVKTHLYRAVKKFQGAGYLLRLIRGEAI
jgi:RNA polymerase sigma-70 factor (ECF subfamily)